MFLRSGAGLGNRLKGSFDDRPVKSSDPSYPPLGLESVGAYVIACGTVFLSLRLFKSKRSIISLETGDVLV